MLRGSTPPLKGRSTGALRIRPISLRAPFKKEGPSRRDPAGARPPRPSPRRPKRLYGDRAYHSREGRSELRRRRIQARIAPPKRPHGSGLGKQRWVVERTCAWLHQYRRLRIRYERRDDIHEAFLAIGCSLICLDLLHPEMSNSLCSS